MYKILPCAAAIRAISSSPEGHLLTEIAFSIQVSETTWNFSEKTAVDLRSNCKCCNKVHGPKRLNIYT